MPAARQAYVSGCHLVSVSPANDSPVHCSMLAEDAIKSAISNYYTKNPKAKATDLGGTGAAMPEIEIEKVSATA